MSVTGTTAAGRFSTVSPNYQLYRPEPPAAMHEALLRLAKVPRPGLVVDLGCGTGISTRPWAAHAERVIGIDPSPEMVSEARRNTSESGVEYRTGAGGVTGLEDGAVDILTCSSSIHWMDPQPTFDEITRVLRPGGVFGAYGPQVPLLPLDDWELGSAVRDFLSSAREIDRHLNGDEAPQGWRWPEILAHCRTVAGFRYADELCFHNILHWTAEQYCGWLKTFSYVGALLEADGAAVASRLEQLEALFLSRLGREAFPVLLSYRLMLGVR